MISAAPAEQLQPIPIPKEGAWIERMISRYGQTPMERIVIAACLKAAGRLVRRHPFVAAEVFVSGVGEGGKVTFRELRSLLQRRRARWSYVFWPSTDADRKDNG